MAYGPEEEHVRPEEAEEMDDMGEKIASLQCRLARAQKERDATKASQTALATALAECVECWDKGGGIVHTQAVFARARAVLDACGWRWP
jgi:hypothetical protein